MQDFLKNENFSWKEREEDIEDADLEEDSDEDF